MATFNQSARPPITKTRTHAGAPAIQPNPMIDLLFTTVCTFIGQDNYYESAGQRTRRIRQLVTSAAARGHDPASFVRLVRALRFDYKIRAAPIVVAAEFATTNPVGATPYVRWAVNAACQRADEPAEFLAYWLATYGRRLPRGVKLGLADAAQRLYNERNVLKWDSQDRKVRMADVIELCHPKPADPEQATLFRHMLDLRHRGKDAWFLDERSPLDTVEDGKWAFNPGHLWMHRNRRVLMEMPQDDRRELLRSEAGYRTFAGAGMTWEQLSAWLPGGMDAEAWQFAIPQMQVMALIRNLRNFDKARLPDVWVDQVISKITTEEDVRASRIFPYQVLSAYEAALSDNWQRALSKTLDLACGNVPSLNRSLLLIDTSGSMQAAVSNTSTVCRIDIAALQAMAIARASESCDVGIYAQASQLLGGDEWRHRSALQSARAIKNMIGAVGHTTFGFSAIRRHFDPARHDRVVIFTDDQQHDAHLDIGPVPQLVTFNIGGYSPKASWGKMGARLNVQVAGYSDKIFAAVSRLLEQELASR